MSLSKSHKSIIIAWTMLLVFSIIYAIWTPSPVGYGVIGYCLGALVMVLIAFPRINFLDNMIYFYSKHLYKVLKLNNRLMEELESINKKKKEKK